MNDFAGIDSLTSNLHLLFSGPIFEHPPRLKKMDEGGFSPCVYNWLRVVFAPCLWCWIRLVLHLVCKVG